jgi:Flp pilus assembly protein TadG
MQRRRAGSGLRDRGAVAVEFALLLPLLLLIVFGIIDFGRALNAQITLTQAAREGARFASVGNLSAAVTTRTQNAALPLLTNVTTPTVTTCAVGAGVGVDAKVVASSVFTFLTPVGAFAAMFGSATFGSSTLTLSSTAEVPCETLSGAVPARPAAARRWICSAATTAGWSPSSSA